jgi:GNAT superfamily N-acetyltransferase
MLGRYSADVIEGWLWNRAPSGYLGAIERGRLFVAERGARIVGFGEAAPGTVTTVYVDPTNILQGIGTVILRPALALARRERNDPVWLEAPPLIYALVLNRGGKRVRSPADQIGIDPGRP